MYVNQKEYELAKEAYEKVIEIDGNYAAPWYGLGNVYRNQKEYKLAKEAYEKAIEIDGNLAHPRNGLGNVYSEQKEYKLAKKHYLEAKNLFEKDKDEYWASYCQGRIELMDRLIRSEENARKEKIDDRITRVLAKIKKGGIAEKAEDNKKNFYDFVKEKPGKKEKPEKNEIDEPYFQVLRRWNSYTPIIADNYHISKGGGYFLKNGDEGIVVDPGFNFIDNFREKKHSFYEIDAVLISHAHNDHASDLESILTLLNRYNNEIKGDPERQQDNTIRDEEAKRLGIAYKDVSDDKVQKAFSKPGRRKTIDLYITKSKNKKYSGILELISSTDYKVHIIDENWEGKVCGVNVKAMPAKHDDIISDRDSVGFVFSLDDTTIVYTGDTGWSDDIEKSYKELTKKEKWYKDKKHKLLVAHLGGFKPYEMDYDVKKSDASAYYKNHLGRLGMVRINEVLEPDVCFMSEFGEELKGYRVDLAEIYDNEFKKTVVLPADIGLTMNLKSKKINAITEKINNMIIKTDRLEDYMGFINPKKVKALLLRKDYSLNYYKEGIKEGYLTDILNNYYDKSTQ